MTQPPVLRSAEAVPASCPALALRASLAASGLAWHEAAAQDAGGNAWATAQAVHQGDRLLRTARSLLSAHARASGDHASLWAADGTDMVAVMAEQGTDGPPRPCADIGPGRRLSVGVQASRLWARAARSHGQQGADAVDRQAWTSLMRLALGFGAGEDGGGGRLLASVWPWRWPMVLVTIEPAPAGPVWHEAQIRSGHAQRHASLGLCLAWGLDVAVA